MEEIGKFQQSVIGSTVNTFKFAGMKTHPIRQHEKAEKNNKIKPEELLKEFENFRNVKEDTPDWKAAPDTVETKLAQNDSHQEEKIIDQLHQLITSEYKEVTQVPTEIVTESSDSFETSTEESAPSPLGLTSDSQSRGYDQDDAVHHISEDDGTFVIVVVGITLCAIAGVVGVGCFIHKPTCPRSTSPFSDCSPTFQSSKLAFSSSPEEKINNSHLSARKSQSGGNKDSDKKVRRDQLEESFRRAGAAPQDSLVNIQPEEDDDDLIYECPGLAPHGEMEVTNPFFLGQDFNMNCGEKKMASCDGGDGPSLINTNNGIRHGNLVRNIKHGQQ